MFFTFEPTNQSKNMKNFLKNLFQFIGQSLLIIWNFLAYKAIYTKNILTEEEMYIEYHFRARWYSPCYWVNQILKGFLYIFAGGLALLACEIRYDFKNNGENIMTGQRGHFEPGLSDMRRKFSRFLVTYSNLN